MAIGEYWRNSAIDRKMALIVIDFVRICRPFLSALKMIVAMNSKMIDRKTFAISNIPSTKLIALVKDIKETNK